MEAFVDGYCRTVIHESLSGKHVACFITQLLAFRSSEPHRGWERVAALVGVQKLLWLSNRVADQGLRK